MYDTDFQFDNRIQRFNNLDKDLLQELQKALMSVNPYVKQLQYVSGLLKKDGNCDIRLTIKTNQAVDMRRYNAPASSEIAVLLPGDGMNASNRDIILYKKGGGVIRINEFNAAYDPLHYVLLFPNGDQGYHFNIMPNHIPEVSMDLVQKLLVHPHNSVNQVENIENVAVEEDYNNPNIIDVGNFEAADDLENIEVDAYLIENTTNSNKIKSKITTMDFYAYRLMIRKNTNQWLQRSGRLGQQYACDMYSKIIGERLNYIRFHQNDFRMTIKSGLEDAVAAGETNVENIGRKIILPSSFTNGPRHLFQLYNDSMAIVTEKGSLFIVFLNSIFCYYSLFFP